MDFKELNLRPRMMCAVLTLFWFCSLGCKEKPSQSETVLSDSAQPYVPSAQAPPPKPTPPEPVPAAKPPVRTFDMLDIFRKPTFAESTEIVWSGKVTGATGRLKKLMQKPCTLILSGEEEVKSELMIRCDDTIVYNSKQPTGGGTFSYSFTLIEVLPTSDKDQYHYQLAYTDTGNRPNRSQAQLITGGRSKVFGEEPSDFVLDIAFQKKSYPRIGKPLYADPSLRRAPIEYEVIVTKVSGRKDIPADTLCTLALTPYAVESDAAQWCIAELACGKTDLYGKKGSIIRNADETARITRCYLDEKTGEIISTTDKRNRIHPDLPKLTVDLSENTASVEDETFSMTFKIRNAEQVR